MKKLIYLIALMLISTHLFASHGMGGEITWTCSGTSYIFKLKFYRDCFGIAGPPGPLTLSNNAGVNIQLNLTSQTDISPVGINGSGNQNCPLCTAATPNGGAVEEFIFTSAPTVIPGTPPVGGWAFWWGDCCRSAFLTNINNGGSWGFALRAKMYPYPGFVSGQCRDNSPYFAEKPSTIICTGYQFTYNHNAVDAELDSIVYSWDSPIDNISYPWTPPIPYQAPYNINNQLPGTPTLNTQSGELTYNPPTGGYFATVIKVTAYKCNVIAAEIWREINVVLISGCSIPMPGGSVPNNPPVLQPPFPDPVTGAANMSYQDTVMAGDTVRFSIPAQDWNTLPNLTFQTMTMTVSGNEWGANYTNENSGCVLSPCATFLAAGFNTPPPIIGVGQINGNFYWRTTCGHVKGLDTMCTRISNTYNFLIKVVDNFCPANGISIGTVRITVKRPPKLLPPKIKCASVLNKFGDVELSWAPPTPRDTHATFADYEIWASLNAAGPYILMDSVYGGLNQYFTTSKLISNARQTALLGTHAQNSSIYFKMYTRCGCDSDSISIESNIVRTMKPVATPGAGGTVNVNWNPVHSPQIATSGSWYYIWKEYPIGTWTLIDSTTTNPAVLTYNDPSTVSICDDTITYRIATNDDSLHCTSWSAFAGIHLINNAPVSTITPNNPAFCNGQNVVLTANPGNATTYLWNTGATTQTITSSTAQTYTVTLTFMPGGCTSTTSTTTSVIPLPTANISGTASICAGQNTNITLTFTGTGPWNYSYNSPAGVVPGFTAISPVNIAVSPVSTFNYTLVSVGTGSCVGNVGGNANITVNTIPSATLNGSASICAGQNTNLTVIFANGPGPYTFIYNPGGIVVNTALNPYVFPVTPASTTNYTLVSMSNVNCPGTISGNATVTVNTIPSATLSGTAAICAGQNANLTVTFANGPGPYTFTYNPGGIVVNTALNPYVFPVTPASTTNYTLVSMSNVNCPGTISGNATITVNTIPSATLSGTAAICAGQNTNLTVTFGNGPGPYTFTYNPGGVVVNTSLNPYVFPVTPAATTNYTLVSMSNVNCPGTVNGAATVTVNNLPTAQITGTQTVCAGQAANLNINFTGTGPWTYTYLANGNPVGPLVANVSPAVIAVNPAATTTYTLAPTVSDIHCTGNASGSATVTVTPLPTAQISGNATVCAGTPTNLTINFTGTPPFVYSYMAGVTLMGPYSTNLNSVTIPVAPTTTTGYSLTPTLTGAGCTGNTSGFATITVNQLPTAAITGSDTICDGTATNLSISFAGAPGPYTYTYTANGVPVGPLNTNSNPLIFPVNPNVNTTYIITNISNANCPGNVTGAPAIVRVTPIPTAVISGTTGICWGQGTNLQIAFTGQAPFTYSYLAGATLNGPFTTSSNPAIVHVTPGITTNYTLAPTVTGNGCTGATSGNALITIHPLPAATISGNPVICYGDQTDLSIAFTTGTAPYTYRYTDGTTVFGPFTASSNPETITVSPLSTKTFTVSTVSDAYCSGTTNGSSLVTVNPLPTAHITGTAAICNGDQTNLNIVFTGTGPFNYSYSDGTSTFGPFVTNNNSVSIPVSPIATTTYSATAISDANCTGIVNGSATVTVNQLPTAVISGTPVICNGQSTSLTVNFTGTAPFVYSYTDGTTTFGPFTTSSNPASIPVSPNVTTIYNLLPVVTGAGCNGAGSGSATVTVNQLPTAVISGNPVICNGVSTTFNISFTGAPPFTYSYSNGSATFGPFTTSNLSETITVSPVLTTTYTLTSLTDDNCTGSGLGQAVVTVNPLPTAQISGTAGICRGISSNLSINFSGTAPYTYTYSDGSGTFGPFTTSNDPEIIPVSPMTTTTYSVTNVSDANCTGNVTGTSATITVYDLPDAVISGGSAICIGASTTFSIAFTIGTAPFTFKYSDGSNIFGPFTTSSNPQIVTVSPSTLGITSYSLIYLNDLHCQGTVSGTANVTVNPLPTPAITGTNVICDGNSTEFSAGAGYTNYLWSTTETTSSITLTVAGNYSVTVTDVNGCVSATSQGLTVNQTPVVSFSNDTSLTCEIPNINFFNTSVFPAESTFYWDFGDNSQSTAENPSHIFNTPGTYPISLIITTQDNCADTLTQDVDIMFYPLPHAEFKAEPTVASVFNSTVNFTDHSQNAVTWNWTFGDGGQINVQNPNHYYDDLGRFDVKLVVTNIAGCVSEYSEPILITPFYVPNAFTPNADGKNDQFFDAGYIMDVASYNMVIFNRWGQKVFENDDYHKFWNGMDKNNKPSQEGGYVYAIKVVTKTGKPFEYQGTVSLIR